MSGDNKATGRHTDRPEENERERERSAPASEKEIEDLRSAVGSLAWIARQCRPDLLYRVSRLQSLTNKATVDELVEANKVMNYARNTAHFGLTFYSGILDWDDLAIADVTEASCANEGEWVPETETIEPFSEVRARR